ncbi:MAG: hypothetical protein IJ716_04605 [Lachnospiraceae bacterium]|nr:hypothetical protein [Lachnospiraceae bacterium]
MRIFRKELRKIFQFRVIVLFALFAVIFGYLFFAWQYYPGYYVNSAYDVPFYEELVAEYGATLSKTEYQDVLKKREELIDQVEVYIREDIVFQENDVTTYAQFQESHAKEAVTDAEMAVQEETNRFWFRNEATQWLLFRIQVLDNMERDVQFGRIYADEDALRIYADFLNSNSYEARERLKALFMRDEMSLLPDAVYELLNTDFFNLVILVVVCCFVLMLPYQISDRLRGILPIAVSTKTGRRIFGKQMAACVVTGGIVAAVLGGIYSILLAQKHVFVFWDCPLSHNPYRLWVDMTMGEYWILCMVLLVGISMTGALLSYFVGRLSSHYITGLAAAIPAAVIYCAGIRFFTKYMFMIGDMYFYRSYGHSLFRTFGGLLLLAGIAVTMVMVLLRRDKERDL